MTLKIPASVRLGGGADDALGRIADALEGATDRHGLVAQFNAPALVQLGLITLAEAAERDPAGVMGRLVQVALGNRSGGLADAARDLKS